MNNNDINQLELFPEIKLFNSLLNNIFQAAPYLRTVRILNVGTKPAPDYTATSPEFDTKYVPSLNIELTAVNFENLSFLNQENIKSFLTKPLLHNTEDLVKHYSTLIYKLVDIALIESKLLIVTKDNSRDYSYTINPNYQELVLNQLWINPIVSEKNQFSDVFNKNLLELKHKSAY